MARIPEPTVEDFKYTLQMQLEGMDTKKAYWHLWGLKTWMPEHLSPTYKKAVEELFTKAQDDMIDLEILEG